MTFRRHLPLSVVLLIGLAAGMTSAQKRSLNILLTNDDGYDAAGLKTMHAALRAAGHQVTVVAPATNMSSSSMSMTSGVIKVENKGERIWAVYGSPADASVMGLTHILRGTPQDLVISGTNAGANLGTSTNNSGTVGAAIAATRYGVPAIAASAGTGEASGAAYDVAAALVTQMITTLDRARPADGRLLPDRVVINLNVPAIPAERLLGIRWALLSARSLYDRVYSDTGVPSEVRSQLTAAAPPAGEQDSDVALFSKGFVTLTLLDGDVSMATAAAVPVVSRLSKLALPQPAGAR
jgi:5'/3'-nucleotidase SurE